MKSLTLVVGAVLIGATALPAGAAQFDFYKLKSPTQAGDFLPSNGVACTGGDLCSSNVDGNVFGGNLSYSNGGVTAVATGTYFSAVASTVQDHEPNWTATLGAGLGVYHESGNTSDDNITSGEKLTITFDQVVKLISISLRSEGHNFTNWSAGDTFLFNNVSTLLPLNVGSIALNQTGQVFTFEYGGAQANQFYLAAMTATPVPEPGTYALLCGGLCALGWVVRRQRSRG